MKTLTTEQKHFIRDFDMKCQALRDHIKKSDFDELMQTNYTSEIDVMQKRFRIQYQALLIYHATSSSA